MCFLMIATHLMEAVHWFKKGAAIISFLQPATVQSLDSSERMNGWMDEYDSVRVVRFGRTDPGFEHWSWWTLDGGKMRKRGAICASFNEAQLKKMSSRIYLKVY